MFGWILNLAYLLLIGIVSPMLIWRSFRQGKYRQGWDEKLLGRLPVRSVSASETQSGPRVWLHAVSVGEVLQLRPIVARLQAARPDCELLITTTTSTGHLVATETFPECTVSYFPLDFTWAVRTALLRVQPDLIVLVELELWPNFIRQAEASGIPLVLVNGRMSFRSYRGYRWIRPLMRGLLNRFARLAVQTEEYASRLIELGAPAECVAVTGSVKFDGIRTNRETDDTLSMGRAFGLKDNERVFIAGSTHEPEERFALETYIALREEFPDLRLILVPRHAERFEEVAKMVESSGLTLVRRSDVQAGRTFSGNFSPTSRPVALLDTLGELTDCWGLADIAFVGGSLTSRGGQNMIEPASYGAAVIVGPNTHNFRDVVEGLQFHDGIRILQNSKELTSAVRQLLLNPTAARRQGEAAQAFVLTQQGATDRTLQILVDRLPSETGKPGRRAA
ncbi:MAG: 3-deoxy-D-manno-octulosonic acid transferase [Planctomycetaceae bacterium]|nr:3-deoxy-D-manno-octulosonic acid transferase [Planctomycetaceae bacterium]